MRGITNPCLFKFKTKDVGLSVHGDDFVAVGAEADLEEVKPIFGKRYKRFGPGDHEVREIRSIKRVARWEGR